MRHNGDQKRSSDWSGPTWAPTGGPGLRRRFRYSAGRCSSSKLRNAAKELVGEWVGQPQCGNLRLATSVEDATRIADLVIDCVPDELESKLEIFSMLDRMAPPQTIFVTPTRALSIADLASCTYRAEKCIAVQFASKDLLVGEKVVLVSVSTHKSRPNSRPQDLMHTLRCVQIGFIQLQNDIGSPQGRQNSAKTGHT